MSLRAFSFSSPKFWLRAHVRAITAVVHVRADVGLTPIFPIAIAVRPSWLTCVLTLAGAACGCRVRNVFTFHATAATVVDVATHIGLTSILHVVVAILPPGVAGILTLVVVALRVGIRNIEVALSTTAAAVVDVLTNIRLAAILHILVAVLPPALASILTLVVVALS